MVNSVLTETDFYFKNFQSLQKLIPPLPSSKQTKKTKVQIVISLKFMNTAERFFTRKAQHIQSAEGLAILTEMAALGQEANRNV